jgi:hypothetical protein
MGKRLLRFLDELNAKSADYLPEHTIARFIREFVGTDSPVDNAELDAQLDQLIGLAKQARNLLKSKHKENQEYES